MHVLPEFLATTVATTEQIYNIVTGSGLSSKERSRMVQRETMVKTTRQTEQIRQTEDQQIERRSTK